LVKCLTHSLHHGFKIRVNHNQPCFFVSFADEVIEMFICAAERVANDEIVLAFLMVSPHLIPAI
jgi:hypothetical protein